MWAHMKFIKFNKTKCKTVHVGQGSPRYKCRLGEERRPAEKYKKYMDLLEQTCP